jgi:hypothetical protein
MPQDNSPFVKLHAMTDAEFWAYCPPAVDGLNVVSRNDEVPSLVYPASADHAGVLKAVTGKLDDTRLRLATDCICVANKYIASRLLQTPSDFSPQISAL